MALLDRCSNDHQMALLSQLSIMRVMITRWHYCIIVEMVIGWIHWVVNVFNCKELRIAKRKHQHLQTAGKDHELGKRDGVPQKERETYG